MTNIFRIVSVGDITAITKQDGLQINKRTIVLQQLGGPYEDRFVAALLGNEADKPLAAGQLVAAALRFGTHDYAGQTYQDIVASEVTSF